MNRGEYNWWIEEYLLAQAFENLGFHRSPGKLYFYERGDEAFFIVPDPDGRIFIPFAIEDIALYDPIIAEVLRAEIEKLM